MSYGGEIGFWFCDPSFASRYFEGKVFGRLFVISLFVLDLRCLLFTPHMFGGFPFSKSSFRKCFLLPVSSVGGSCT